MRPAVIKLVDAALPRTSTRKVKRAELRELVMRLEAAEKAVDVAAGDELESAVRAAVATIGRRRPGEVTLNMTLRGDLGFDSLMALELLVALEARFGALDGDRLSRCTTVGDVVGVLREVPARRAVSRTREIEREDEEPLELPEPLREAAMAWMAQAQMGFYRRVMRTRVTGRAFIPHNRSTLVVANHASHLDMGLVKYALGSYGKNLAALAAQDYFFEGNRWRKAYFEQLTNLVPMSRSGSLRQALRQVGELIEQGKTILIFPEGTRSVDGSLLPFKPAVGHLALQHGVDVLPVWLGGTHAALPKGATVLRSRNLVARINPPLSAARLREMTAGLSSSDAARVVARIAQLAVEALSRGETLSLDDVDVLELRRQTLPPPDVLEGVFEELERRFDPSAVEAPLSFYFALGEDRWTLRMTPDSCDVARGKLVDSADCVLKTSPDTFRRIVREAYTPTPQEFMTGQIKTNNVAHLLTFQKVFRLQTPSAEWEASADHAPTTGVFPEEEGEVAYSGPRARAAGARKETA